MSAENVEIVRSLQVDGVDLVELFENDTLDEVYPPEELSPFADDLKVEFVSPVAGSEPATYKGLEGFVAGWRDWLEPWQSYRVSVEDLIDAGDCVVTLIRVEGKTARDGVAVQHEPAAVWTLAGGKVVSIGLYLDRADAFREAGLPAPDSPVEEPRR